MTDQSPDDMVFLLRLWRVNEDDGVRWRASLEASNMGERRGFADIDRLCAYLEEQCHGQPDSYHHDKHTGQHNSNHDDKNADKHDAFHQSGHDNDDDQQSMAAGDAH